MLNIIMIIIKVLVATILSIFLAGLFYGTYFALSVVSDKKPKKPVDWLMTNEEYEEFIKLVENLKNISKKN